MPLVLFVIATKNYISTICILDMVLPQHTTITSVDQQTIQNLKASSVFDQKKQWERLLEQENEQLRREAEAKEKAALTNLFNQSRILNSDLRITFEPIVGNLSKIYRCFRASEDGYQPKKFI